MDGHGRVQFQGEVHHARWDEPERSTFWVECEQQAVSSTVVACITTEPLSCARCRAWARRVVLREVGGGP